MKLLTSLLSGGPFRELIKYMKVAFVFNLAHYTSFLEEVIGDLSTDGLTVRIEHDLEIFSLDRRNELKTI